MPLNKDSKEGMFSEQERAKAGRQVIMEIPHSLFIYLFLRMKLRVRKARKKKKCPDCLLDRHNTRHLSKAAALSLLEMCAQYNVPSPSYLG